MHYGKIPDKILNLILYEGYEEDVGFFDVTVRSILEEVDQDIICSDYETNSDDKRLVKFTAWTQYTIFQLVDDGIDPYIMVIDRHPYSFIYKRR